MRIIKNRVQAKKDLKAFEDVFLIDHAFSFRYSDLRKGLEEHSQLRDRLKNMLKFSGTKKPHPTIEAIEEPVLKSNRV